MLQWTWPRPRTDWPCTRKRYMQSSERDREDYMSDRIDSRRASAMFRVRPRKCHRGCRKEIGGKPFLFCLFLESIGSALVYIIYVSSCLCTAHGLLDADIFVVQYSDRYYHSSHFDVCLPLLDHTCDCKKYPFSMRRGYHLTFGVHRAASRCLPADDQVVSRPAVLVGDRLSGVVHACDVGAGHEATNLTVRSRARLLGVLDVACLVFELFSHILSPCDTQHAPSRVEGDVRACDQCRRLPQTGSLALR